VSLFPLAVIKFLQIRSSSRSCPSTFRSPSSTTRTSPRRHATGQWIRTTAFETPLQPPLTASPIIAYSPRPRLRLKSDHLPGLRVPRVQSAEWALLQGLLCCPYPLRRLLRRARLC
jgi:hypothetical protein